MSISDDSSRNSYKTSITFDYNRKLVDSATELEAVDIAPLVDMVLRPQLRSARVGAKMMHTDVDPRPNAAPAEPMLLRACWIISIPNRGAPWRRIRYICIRSRSALPVYIDVVNSGEPIPQTEREMIFEPFRSHQRKGR